MDDTRVRALEARVEALETAMKGAQTNLQWAVALIFIVPVGLMIVLRVWS